MKTKKINWKLWQLLNNIKSEPMDYTLFKKSMRFRLRLEKIIINIFSIFYL